MKIQSLELLRSRNEKLALIAGIGFLIIFSYLIFRQRRQSEKLLLNILPGKIAKRLKKKEYPIADYIKESSILFADIVNFTELSSKLGAEKTVDELNKIFIILDKLTEKNGLEKIKTIGDCYMAASGVPNPRADHAIRASELAFDIQKEFKHYFTDDNFPIFFRIGIDCGDVAAGVIGEKKFIYDLWGDTVNIASRMEEYGEPGKIQITERFKNAIENSSNIKERKGEFTFEERGEIEIKGKGKMKTWFINIALQY